MTDIGTPAMIKKAPTLRDPKHSTPAPWGRATKKSKLSRGQQQQQSKENGARPLGHFAIVNAAYKEPFWAAQTRPNLAVSCNANQPFVMSSRLPTGFPSRRPALRDVNELDTSNRSASLSPQPTVATAAGSTCSTAAPSPTPSAFATPLANGLRPRSNTQPERTAVRLETLEQEQRRSEQIIEDLKFRFFNSLYLGLKLSLGEHFNQDADLRELYQQAKMVEHAEWPSWLADQLHANQA
eukprot:m.5985 g.5985  ORF g.5985 m.5985 type:complete len:239 (-) comp2507_c0_seq1:356-1072(-)